MIKWYKKVVFKNYINFNGRARREEYWMFILLHTIISIVLAIVDRVASLTFGDAAGITRTMYNFFIFLPLMALVFRRLHDIGKSGWLCIMFQVLFTSVTFGLFYLSLIIGYFGEEELLYWSLFIALVIIVLLAFIWLIILLCKEGDKGVNQYGPDPKNELEYLSEIGKDLN